MLQRNSHFAALLALLVVSVSGCATATKVDSKSPAAAFEAAKPALSEAAAKALAQAEADVKMAKAKFALWSTADQAFNAAQEAAKVGDSAKVIEEAEFASNQVKGGLEQLNYPSTEI